MRPNCFSGVCFAASNSNEVKYVSEGEDVTLKCRFTPTPEFADSSWFWVKNIAGEYSNAAAADIVYPARYWSVTVPLTFC